MVEFKEFPKMARFSRDIVITEKIDGTNASIFIQPKSLEVDEENGLSTLSDSYIIAMNDNYTMRAGSRTKWVKVGDDNHGWAGWVTANATELFNLGEGLHFGEWWGSGIQRGYGLVKGDKRFTLFNTGRWCWHGQVKEGRTEAPICCGVVPILYEGPMDTVAVDYALNLLKEGGSRVSTGFMKPEGIIIFHTAANIGFKKTIEKDEGKWA